LKNCREFIFRLVEGTFEFCFFQGTESPPMCLFYFLFFSFSFFPKLKKDGKIFYRLIRVFVKANPEFV
jgi:hypothetical protein